MGCKNIREVQMCKYNRCLGHGEECKSLQHLSGNHKPLLNIDRK